MSDASAESLIDWCTRERDEAIKSIEFWSEPNAMIQGIQASQAIIDMTPQHIEHLKRVVDDMNRIIDAYARDKASSR